MRIDTNALNLALDRREIELANHRDELHRSAARPNSQGINPEFVI